LKAPLNKDLEIAPLRFSVNLAPLPPEDKAVGRAAIAINHVQWQR
jgi:hypothetical protein